jgi:hypothetical protein
MAIGARGRRFALELQRGIPFPQTLERTLEAAAARQKIPHAARSPAFGAATRIAQNRFPLTQLVAAEIGHPFGNEDANNASVPPGRAIDLASADRVLDAVEQAIADGRTALRPLAAAVQIEMAVAAAEDQGEQTDPSAVQDPLFRLRSRQWAMPEDGLAGLVPVRDPQLHILAFDYDVADFLGARTAADFPAVTRPGPSHIVAFGNSGGERRQPLIVDGLTAHILVLSDGRLSAAEIAAELGRQSDSSVEADSLKWIEHLFVCGLIWLRDSPIHTRTGISSSDVVSDGGIVTAGAIHHRGLGADD